MEELRTYVNVNMVVVVVVVAATATNRVHSFVGSVSTFNLRCLWLEFCVWSLVAVMSQDVCVNLRAGVCVCVCVCVCVY